MGPEQAPTRAAVLELRAERIVVEEAYDFLDEKRLLLAAELLRQVEVPFAPLEGAAIGVHVLDDLEERVIRDVRDVDHDSEPVHLLHRLYPEAGQPGVDSLQATLSGVIGLHVSHLHDPHAQPVKSGKPVKVVLDGRKVLEAKYDPCLVCLLGLFDVGHGPDLADQITVYLQRLMPPGDVFHCLDEIFENGHRGIDRGQTALAHVSEHLP